MSFLTVWRLNPKSALHFRRWGNEWVVFDVGSGHTHEMDTISAVTLMHCESGWVHLNEISQGVAKDLDLPVSMVSSERLLPFLNQFASMGLLENLDE